MSGVCYGELCSRHPYCRASLSVGAVRSLFSSSSSSLCLCVCVCSWEFSALCSVCHCWCPNNWVPYFSVDGTLRCSVAQFGSCSLITSAAVFARLRCLFKKTYRPTWVWRTSSEELHFSSSSCAPLSSSYFPLVQTDVMSVWPRSAQSHADLFSLQLVFRWNDDLTPDVQNNLVIFVFLFCFK